MSLRLLFSRPVGVLLGQPETVYLVSPLRPVDLADLESLAFATWQNPVETLPATDENTPEHRHALRKALDAAEAGPPAWSDTNNPELSTASAMALLRAVMRNHPGMTEEALQILAMQLTATQWQRIYRVAWGVDPARELIQRIDRLIGFPPDPPDGVPWAQAIASLAESTGWTLEVIGQLSLASINLLRNGGKPVDPWDSGPEMPISELPTQPDGLQAAREKFFSEGAE